MNLNKKHIITSIINRVGVIRNCIPRNRTALVKNLITILFLCSIIFIPTQSVSEEKKVTESPASENPTEDSLVKKTSPASRPVG